MFSLKFDWTPYAKLDGLALLVSQRHCKGNESKWFNNFRGGIIGFRSRLKGVEIHFNDIHEWGKLLIKDQLMIEYHIASVFFNMDSSLECFTFALNSLGYAVDAGEFKDITSEIQLKQISPMNIYGNNKVNGYDKYFNHTKQLFIDNANLLQVIIDQHDVSKHRQAIFMGGRYRSDPPDKFFEKLGIESNYKNEVLYAPFSEIVLKPEPKSPILLSQTAKAYKDHDKLEEIGPKFCTFINELGWKALNDAQMNIVPLI